MSTLTLPLVAGKIRVAPQPLVVMHPLLAPKRLLQLALIALVVAPIPSDDGLVNPHTPAVAQVKSALPVVMRVNR